MRNIFLTISLSFATSLLAAPPQRVEISYDVSRNGTSVAEATHRLEHDGKSYTLSEKWKGKGVFALAGDAERTSHGAIVPDGLRPVAFEDKRTRRETRRADFDPADKTPTLERQDQLSMGWTFAFAHANRRVTPQHRSLHH